MPQKPQSGFGAIALEGHYGTPQTGPETFSPRGQRHYNSVLASYTGSVFFGAESLIAIRLNTFVDFLSLVYHEGRYATTLPAGSTRAAYQKLIDYFAKDFERHRAWKKLQPIRQTASVASSATHAEEIFKHRFAVNLEQLHVLFMDPSFEGKNFGGKRWASIVTKVIGARDMLDQKDEHAAEQLLQEIAQTMHNTRTCGQKLAALDSKLTAHSG